MKKEIFSLKFYIWVLKTHNVPYELRVFKKYPNARSGRPKMSLVFEQKIVLRVKISPLRISKISQHNNGMTFLVERRYVLLAHRSER